MANATEGEQVVTFAVQGSPKRRLENLIATATSSLPASQGASNGSLSEAALVKAGRKAKAFVLRRCLSGLYTSGYFATRDPIKGYAWTLAAWNGGSSRGYEDTYELAEDQQYYEFFLSAQEQERAIALLDGLLTKTQRAQPNFVRGNPFNPRWWGWIDDPIPARPGERDFKAGFVTWLAEHGYSEAEVAAVLARCPPSDGPTRAERVAEAAKALRAVRRPGEQGAG